MRKEEEGGGRREEEEKEERAGAATKTKTHNTMCGKTCSLVLIVSGVRSMGATICILPSHVSTKTSRTWKFGAFYPNANNMSISL